jgi:hypothetical protein
MQSAGGQTVRSFFRSVKRNPTSREEFLSNAAKGKKPRNPTPEVVRRWDGISAFTTFDAALANARIWPRLGRFIAELHIADSSPITFAPHPPPGEEHVTLWGDPDVLFGTVVDIVQIR